MSLRKASLRAAKNTTKHFTDNDNNFLFLIYLSWLELRKAALRARVCRENSAPKQRAKTARETSAENQWGAHCARAHKPSGRANFARALAQATCALLLRFNARLRAGARAGTRVFARNTRTRAYARNTCPCALYAHAQRARAGIRAHARACRAQGLGTPPSPPA